MSNTAELNKKLKTEFAKQFDIIDFKITINAEDWEAQLPYTEDLKDGLSMAITVIDDESINLDTVASIIHVWSPKGYITITEERFSRDRVAYTIKAPQTLFTDLKNWKILIDLDPIVKLINDINNKTAQYY